MKAADTADKAIDTPRLGVAYYPECLAPSEWPRDLELMAEGGITTVRLAEFAWSAMEPREGEIALDWLEEFVNLAGEAGIESILGTPTEAPPPWLTAAYPDTLPVDAQGLRRGAGGRRHCCINHPDYIARGDRIVEVMARRFGTNPHVLGWQLDNEAACHRSLNCFCPVCERRFREWLEEKYGTIDALNDAWYTAFWSHGLTTFDQVFLVTNSVNGSSPQYTLDLMKFGGDSWVGFLERQCASIRHHAPRQLITHNITWYQELLDWRRLNRNLDVVGIDIYQRDPVTQTTIDAVFSAVKRDRKFWVMEMPPGMDERDGDSRVPMSPERHFTYFARHWLRGAALCSMWHFRRHRGGHEMMNAACRNHDGTMAWSYEGVKRAGRLVAQHGDLLRQNRPVRRAAILTTYEDRLLAHIHARHLYVSGGGPVEAVVPWVRALERRGVGVAFAGPDEELASYGMVLAPHSYLLTPSMTRNLRGYVEGGGVLVGFGGMGRFDRFGRALTEPPPGCVRTLFGCTVGPAKQVGETELIAAGGQGPWEDSRFHARRGYILYPDDAEIVAVYDDFAVNGNAAITRRSAGRGWTVMVGLQGESDDTRERMVEGLLRHTGLSFRDPDPEGLERIEGTHLTGYINTTADRRLKVVLDKERTDLVSGHRARSFTLEPWQVAIVDSGLQIAD